MVRTGHMPDRLHGDRGGGDRSGAGWTYVIMRCRIVFFCKTGWDRVDALAEA